MIMVLGYVGNWKQALGPIHTYSNIFENGVFFSFFAFRLYVTENGGFRKRSPERRLLITQTFRIRVDGRKQRFTKAMMSSLESSHPMSS